MRNATVSFALLLMLTVVAAAGQNGPQAPASGGGGGQDGITFRSEIEYVELDAVVTDKEGFPVGNLTADDFEVIEDKKPQRISVFLPLRLPFTPSVNTFAGPGARPEPDVRSNGPLPTGRLYVIVLDDLNTHFSQTNRMKGAAKEFIGKYLAANDLAALVLTSGTADANEELTTDRQRLLAAVDKFVGKRLTSSTLERLQNYRGLKNQAASEERAVTSVADPIDPLRAFHARQTFEALRGVGEYLMGVRGRRKSIVYLSEGVDYDMNDLVGENFSDTAGGAHSGASDVFSAFHDAMASVARAGAAIYAIDPRPTQLGGEFIDFQELATEAVLNIGPATLQREMKLAEDSLRTLAEETGGFAVVNRADYRIAFDRLREENSVYYLIGYYPTTTRRTGRFYKTEVKVKRPDLQVRARRGYMIPKPRPANDERVTKASAGTTAELREALGSPVSLDGLGLSATAVAFRGSEAKPSVAVVLQINPSRLVFTERDGRFSGALEVSYLAIDRRGRTRAAQRDTVALNLRPQTHEQALREGIRLVSRLSLASGRYQLRIGARDTNGSLIGTVAYDLDVPEFAKPALAMSGLVIASRRTAQIPTPRPDPIFEQELAGQPTTVRTFAPDDVLSVGADIYLNGPAGQRPVDVVTTLTSSAGLAVFRAQDTYEPQDGVKAALRVTQISLKNFAAGTYVVRVTAKARVGTDPPVEHAVPITIVSSGG